MKPARLPVCRGASGLRDLVWKYDNILGQRGLGLQKQIKTQQRQKRANINQQKPNRAVLLDRVVLLDCVVLLDRVVWKEFLMTPTLKFVAVLSC